MSRTEEFSLSHRAPVRPTYPESFRCIGSECEDTCCHGWSVPIDRATWQKYQALPPSPLRVLIDENLILAPKDATAADGFGSQPFAKIRMTASNSCPMLTSDRLCQIQAQCGESHLSYTCSTFPRINHTADGVEERALALSCPEAVRVALLKPMDWKRLGPSTVTGGGANQPAPANYWPIRAVVFETVRDRDYPLWQRLLMLGILCERLDALAGQPAEQVTDFLSEFSDAVFDGRMQLGRMELPYDLTAQLDAVLRLAGLMLHKSNVTPRFAECVNAFTSGIGNGPEATLESLTAGFRRAHDRYFAPFFERHPHIFENYLVNTIVRSQFPFGSEGMKQGATVSMSREFTKLMAQFALMKGMLIGVAGFHESSFSAEHIVHTVQSASKHFDHHPDFPRLAYELLVECKLDGLQGAAILGRNAAPAKPRRIFADREHRLPGMQPTFDQRPSTMLTGVES